MTAPACDPRSRESLRRFTKDVQRESAHGDATEHTFRPALKSLIESLAEGVTATNEPKREACGAPDFAISREVGGLRLTLGHLEAKTIDADLEQIERDSNRANPTTREGRQLRRYRQALSNLVLTNHLQFRWYVDGELRLECELVPSVGAGVKVPAADATAALLTAFLDHEPVPITTPSRLAQRMAQLTHLVRETIVEALESEHASDELRAWHSAFEEVLVPDLEVAQFADMFAQTLAYGLFAARCNHTGNEPFRRQDAASEIPKTNPFLRALFDMVTGVSLQEEPFAGFVDDLTQMLAIADMNEILRDFGKRTSREDPMIHFYETFLATYDPALRERRGVYYTPEPVVSFIVRSADQILTSQFDCRAGLADAHVVQVQRLTDDGGSVVEELPRVLVLDPACGTGTFLYAVVDLIRSQFMRERQGGQWSSYVRSHLLNRIFGFELLVAPYAVAHLKLGMQLAAQDLPDVDRQRWAYDFAASERLGIFLTNTLEEAEKKSKMLFGQFIAEEANAAARVKSELPIMVIVGNPPYSGHSANNGKWIRHLVLDYLKNIPDGEQPRQKKWIQDDYIKFIRFGQWRIERTGHGILAFITNHSYLDSPTFKGMRKSLMSTFDRVYVLDLHGNAKKGTVSPDGSPDQNVFDIQQGVAISLFVRDSQPTDDCIVHHADLWGTREAKNESLFQLDVTTVKWQRISPEAPSYLFVPQDKELRDEFQSGIPIPELMNQSGRPAPGIVTTHDQFAISWSPEEAAEKVEQLLGTSSIAEARALFKLCSQKQWDYDRAKKELSRGDWRERTIPIYYRPYDVRYTVYDSNVAVHLRRRVTSHMLMEDNIALLTTRMTKGQSFRHAHVTQHVSEVICLSPKTSSNAFVFPLYVSVDDTLDLGGSKRANLNPKVIREISARTGLTFKPEGPGNLEQTFGPEDVLHYVYAILHSGTYRSRYDEWLQREFPRIQFTRDRNLFVELCQVGAELVDLHLLRSGLLEACDNPLTSPVAFPEAGDNYVEGGHPKYLAPGEADPIDGTPIPTGRVYISKPEKKAGVRGQYFDGIDPDVWLSCVGGYQVCEKWLKNRRGRSLTDEELVRYQKIVVALRETARLMGEIDALVPSWPLP